MILSNGINWRNIQKTDLPASCNLLTAIVILRIMSENNIKANKEVKTGYNFSQSWIKSMADDIDIVHSKL